MTFKVCEEQHPGQTRPLPSFLQKDMVLTLVSGKWPLGDYTDCGKHLFTFKKPDDSEVSMWVRGFTWDCSVSKEEQAKLMTEGQIPSIDVVENLNNS